MTAAATFLDTTPSIVRSTWLVWGTQARIAVAGDRLEPAVRICNEQIRLFDLACNRFRPDSELSLLNRSGSAAQAMSPVLSEAILAACRAAELTDGLVDPTVGGALSALGYDDDIDIVRLRRDDATPRSTGPAPGWRCLRVDDAGARITIPPGVLLDLGATAKALCVDRAATAIWKRLGCSVVVEIGGDLAVAGPPPPGGWRVSIQRVSRHRASEQEAIAVFDGGVASSGTTSRVWKRGGGTFHHIIDPRSGLPAETVWELVTVAAGSCLDANTASTAAVLWGEEAPFRLAQLGLPARLARPGGEVVTVADWPFDSSENET
jgi:thiamine biosynthesis lipoprotein